MANIIWIDDEIDNLTSLIIFLEQKGYHITSFTNGFDAIEYLKTATPDIVLLDESMPGMNGLDVLLQIKALQQELPIIMITKNETEDLMEDAIGSAIADYLIKPVNPNQILLSLKKILKGKNLVAEKVSTSYQQEFRNLFIQINECNSAQEWQEIYKKLIHWEIEISQSQNKEMLQILQSQKEEANIAFSKFITQNYAHWVQNNADAPTMSHHLLQKKVFPQIEQGTSLFFVLIDNLRLDQWQTIRPMLMESYNIVKDDTYYSILPTATQYARNSIFSGMLPLEIQKRFPDKWKNDDDEGGKNLHEPFFLEHSIKRLQNQNIKHSYTKVLNSQDSQQLAQNIHNLLNNDLNIIVYNFVDMLSHARTEMEVLKELANDEASYRSLSKSWFEHSRLLEMLKKIASKKVKIIITTDHGSIQIKNPIKIIGDKQTSTNLRYKVGRSLTVDEKAVLQNRNPASFFLPSPNLNSSYVFAKEYDFLCYPNNYNHYVQYYKNSFQHGGISLEEIIVPIATLIPK